jgi:hypothetical protein
MIDQMNLFSSTALHCRLKRKFFSCEFLGIDDGGGRADVTASKATLRLRAYCADVPYIPPKAGHCCGELILPGRNDSDLNVSLRGCIMDTDRNTKKSEKTS